MTTIHLTTKQVKAASLAIAAYALNNTASSEVMNGILQAMNCGEISTQQLRLANLNRQLQEITKPIYLAQGEFEKQVTALLLPLGLSADGFYSEQFEGNTNDGRQNFHIGSDIYLTWSWYKMHSGKFEIVAYFHA